MTKIIAIVKPSTRVWKIASKPAGKRRTTLVTIQAASAATTNTASNGWDATRSRPVNNRLILGRVDATCGSELDISEPANFEYLNRSGQWLGSVQRRSDRCACFASLTG